LRALEIFSGAGGLAIGIAQAGFKHQAMIEWNEDACATIRQNKLSGNELAGNWPLYEIDVCNFNYDSIESEIDLLAAGPPCQPFSLAGKHKGDKDHRNMFPEIFKAVLKLSPKAILIENVRGLGRESFSEYLNYILLQLSFPEISKRSTITTLRDKGLYGLGNRKNTSRKLLEFALNVERVENGQRVSLTRVQKNMINEYLQLSSKHTTDIPNRTKRAEIFMEFLK
jgi:site-specific DNA-cytosine methylase